MEYMGTKACGENVSCGEYGGLSEVELPYITLSYYYWSLGVNVDCEDTEVGVEMEAVDTGGCLLWIFKSVPQDTHQIS